MPRRTKGDDEVTTGIRVFKGDADRLTLLAEAEKKSVAQLIFEFCDEILKARLKVASPELDRIRKLKSELHSLEQKAIGKIQG